VRILEPDYSRSSPAVVSDHHVFCLPSRFEGFGLAALEAMLAARPVLVSDVSGIAPHVRAARCGVVVESKVSSIRAGIREMLACKDQWAAMGQRGREYVMAKLKWETIAEESLKAYRKLGGAVLPTEAELSLTMGLPPKRELLEQHQA